jgi:hypothetical protein
MGARKNVDFVKFYCLPSVATRLQRCSSFGQAALQAGNQIMQELQGWQQLQTQIS